MRSILRITLLVFLALVVLPLAANGQDPEAEAEVKSVLAEFEAAQQRLDVDALKKILAPKFTQTSFNCGSNSNERMTRDEALDDLRTVATLNPEYTRNVTGRSTSFLGGGPMAVVRQNVTETMSFESGSLSLDAAEALYFAKIGGTYKITSRSTRILCDSFQLEGSLPTLPED